MNIIEEKIKQVINILNRQDWTAIQFETIGTVSIKFVLQKPKYKLMKRLDRVKLYDNPLQTCILANFKFDYPQIINIFYFRPPELLQMGKLLCYIHCILCEKVVK